QVEACVPGDAAHCYRVRGGGDLYRYVPPPRGGRLLGVDETTDAGRTWHTAWEVPAERWPFVVRQHGPPDVWILMTQVASAAVLVREVPGGHEVFVANGVEGLAVRGVDGAWRRVPVVNTATGLAIRPLPLTGFGRGIGDDITTAGLITLLALLIGMSVASGRAGARTRAGRGFTGVLVLLGFFVLLAFLVVRAVEFVTPSAGTATGLGLGVALCLVGAGVGLTLNHGLLRNSRAAVVMATAVLTGLAFVGPVLGWTAGYPQARGSALELGAVLAAGCLVGVVAAGWWAGRDPVERR
ncbi:MAG TPA: hypothetical protein VNO31_20305, partial [Umezawaea sp.]|nr:hypothetical protein [Umezawaea sp.]